ncbi:MAG: methionyl-tRNA formyltransferase [Chlorobiales bacterium]|nr:methionyl-tRNA formyltransferase [Chlorobiales bacterium]
MNVIFMGTPDFSVPSLKKIIQSDLNITLSLVVTSPDKPRQNARSEPQPTPVKRAALELGLPVLEVEDIKSPEFAAKIREAQPDVIVVVAFRILPEQVFTIPTKGTFNLHASLLPKYRGAAPINWAIINGDKESGVTTFFIQQKVDTGTMILQRKTAIGENETATELAVRLADIGAEAVVETLRMIAQNQVQPAFQDDALATKAPKLTKENTRIEWGKSATRVFDFIRGLADRPTAWTMFEGKMVKIYSAAPCAHRETDSVAPGTWLIRDGKLMASCGNEPLEVLSLQIEGKNRMSSTDFLRGYRPHGKERFE